MPVRQRIVLVAAGAGGGIAATFNSPLGGMAFAIELMLPVVTARSVLAVALATTVATQIGRIFFGTAPSFDVPALATLRAADVSMGVLPWFLLCGLAIGLLATLMTRAIYWFEDRFDAMPGNYYTRHTLGMLAVGLILYGFMTLAGPALRTARPLLRRRAWATRRSSTSCAATWPRPSSSSCSRAPSCW